MLFSSNIFLFFFLPGVLAIYFVFYKKNWRNLFLFLASLFFYAWGEHKFVFVMFAVIIFNYRMALAIFGFKQQEQHDEHKKSKMLLVITIIVNLALLFYYKYCNFVVYTANKHILSYFEYQLPVKNIVLPIGISFFIFQAMAYVIDVYRGTIPVQTKFGNVGLYISFFPQLIAGPIVRYGTIAGQIENRTDNFTDFSYGVQRFIAGLGKKMLLANNMGLIADKAFALNDIERSVTFAWVGAIAYSFQILFDFSGYSDMAIGLGRMFGFKFLENFNYPYISRSISEFWRRWHISLGSWFRDYVYIPLGGSRVKSKAHLVFNLFVVWLLTGVWHGANWNFVFWGLLYFVLITFEKLSGFPEKSNSRFVGILYRIFTLFAILIGWVLFRGAGLEVAINYLFSMFGAKDNPLFCVNTIAAFRDYWFFMLFAFLCSTPLFKILKERVVYQTKSNLLRITVNILSAVIYLFIFAWSSAFVFAGTYNPFIYFNF
jgi:alginate O-acetyltransferase complex protein AlgI